jgi:serine/threonine protein kinase
MDRAKVIYGLAAGLAYLHGQDLVHPNLRPEYIRFTAANEIRIASFFHEQKQGSAYEAPEVSSVAETGAANMWSFARIVCDLFSGEAIPEPTNHLIRLCLSREPDRRPTAFDVLRVLRKPNALIQELDQSMYRLYIQQLDNFSMPIIPIPRQQAKKARKGFMSDFLISASDYQYDRDSDVSLIGEGSIAQVFLAIDKEGRKVALKMYDQRVAKQKAFARGLLREIEVMIRLRHPAILRLIGHQIFHRSDNQARPIVVVEFCRKGTLLNAMADFTPTERMKAVYGVVSGVCYMHTLIPHVIHRDLKPENVFVDDNNEIHIGDFNQAKESREQLLSASAQFGSPVYQAPEVDVPGANYDPSVDVYTVGMIVYTILEGRVPFSELPLVERVSRLRAGLRPNFEAVIPDILKKLVQRCWAQAPVDRDAISDIERVMRNLRESEVLEGTVFEQYRAYANGCDYAHNSLRKRQALDLALSARFKPLSKFIWSDSPPMRHTDLNRISLVGRRNHRTQTTTTYVAKELIQVDPVTERSLLREVEALSRCSHRTIVNLHAWNCTPTGSRRNPVVFLEYLPNGDLYNVSLDATRKMTTICGLASALEILDRAEISHFDLTPSDVMFRADNEVCLVDFNRAQEYGTIATFDWNSDLRYKAPELLGGASVQVNSTIDVYAFGMIMVFILTDSAPFAECLDLEATIRSGSGPEIEPFSNDALLDLIHQCVSIDPTNRPRIDEIVRKLRDDKTYLLPLVDHEVYDKYVSRTRPVKTVPVPHPPKQPRSAGKVSPRGQLVTGTASAGSVELLAALPPASRSQLSRSGGPGPVRIRPAEKRAPVWEAGRLFIPKPFK